jgi:hypothetical protein
MLKTLQSIINLLENPAYLQDKNGIVIVNDLFTASGFSEKNYEKQITSQKCKVNKRKINGELTLVEIVPNDIFNLKECTKKLTKAITLL